MNENIPGCRVAGCRYKNTHRTTAHKCGTCDDFGHGQKECGNDVLTRDLYHPTHYSMFSDTFDALQDKDIYNCESPVCYYRQTHDSSAHEPEFEKDIGERSILRAEKLSRRQLTGNPGKYVKVWIGHGYYYIFRNNEGTIEKTMTEHDNYAEINEYTAGYTSIDFKS